MIDNGLDASKVDLVVTDMLPAYNEVIAKLFPNAKHQYCTFHFIQKFNSLFKDTLTAHRQEKFAVGDRKEAHKISFLLLKGQEKLTKDEQNIVTEFGKKHPTMLAAYALKEDIRHLYANAKSVAEAYACKDMLEETYRKAITPTMEKALDWFNAHFDKTVSYLEKGYMLDRTNNDAERMMRTIKRTQQTHYFLRNENNYIKKIRVVLGIQIPIAA